MTDTPKHPGLVTVRMPRDLIEEIRALAVEHDRSLSAELRQALGQYVAREANARRTGEAQRLTEERRLARLSRPVKP